MTQRQKLRKKVFDKYNGKCAYTGAELPVKWEIDHLAPMPRNTKGIRVINANTFDNLMPTFKFINLFKKNRDINEWRTYLIDFNKRLEHCKVNGKDVRVRAKYKKELMELFGIAKDKPFSGVFYFETIEKPAKPFEMPPSIYNNHSLSDIVGEIWQPIKKYKLYYLVSNFGRIKTVLRVDGKGQTRKEIIKKQQVSKEGHLVTLFSVDRVRRTERVDIIVADTFLSNPNNLPYLHHKDKDRLNIRHSNLFWSNKKII